MTKNELELMEVLDSITSKNRNSCYGFMELSNRIGQLRYKMMGPSDYCDMLPSEIVAVYLSDITDAINEHPDKYGKYKAEYDALVADVEAFIEKYSG